VNDTTATIPASVAIAAPSSADLQRGAASALDLVQSFEVVDAATFEIAADELKAIKGKIDALNEKRLGITKPLDAAKAAVMALFKPPIALLEQAEGILKQKMHRRLRGRRPAGAGSARRAAPRAAGAAGRRLREAARPGARDRHGDEPAGRARVREADPGGSPLIKTQGGLAPPQHHERPAA